jgi:hypothetical protein
MKHTPGPWSLSEDVMPPGCFEGHDGFTQLVKDSNGMRLAEIIGQDEENEAWLGTDESNASLIAAAPDLFEACKFALKWINASVPIMTPKGLVNILLEKAINKAEGKD